MKRVLVVDNERPAHRALTDSADFLDVSRFSGARQVGNAISQEVWDEVRIRLSLRLKGSDLPAGLDVVRWLRARPSNRFGILGYTHAGEMLERQTPVFSELFGGAASPTHAFWQVTPEGEPPPLSVHAESVSRLAADSASSLIREAEPEFRHTFHSSVLAAARILLGAVRCGMISVNDGKHLMVDLQKLSQQPPTPELDKDLQMLLTWYLESRQISGGEGGQAKLRGWRVVLLDDQCESAGWNLVFQQLFGTGNYFGFASVSEALQKLGTNAKVDLLMVDLKLGEADRNLHGFDFIRSVRHRHLDLPIIGFSGLDDAKTSVAVLGNGADWYFAKALDSSADRDSEDYFRKLSSLVCENPRWEAQIRRHWRRFSLLEPRLRAEPEKALSADFFKLSYFFSTDRKILSDGSTCPDVRHEVLFRKTEYAAHPALSQAIRILLKSITGSDSKAIGWLFVDACKVLGVAPSDQDTLYRAIKSLPRHDRGVATPEQFNKAVTSYLTMAELSVRKRAGGLLPPLGAAGRTGNVLGLESIRGDGSGARGALAAWESADHSRHKLPEVTYWILDYEANEWTRFLNVSSTGGDFRAIPLAPPLALRSTLHKELAQRKGSVLWINTELVDVATSEVYQLIRGLRQEFFNVPILAVSEYPDSLWAQRVLRNGATSVLSTRHTQSPQFAEELLTALADLGRQTQKHYPARLWGLICRLRNLTRAGEASDYADMLALAYFCKFGETSLCETWRTHYLLPEGPRRTMAYWMLGRVAEQVRETTVLSPAADDDVNMIIASRNRELYGGPRTRGTTFEKCIDLVCGLLSQNFGT